MYSLGEKIYDPVGNEWLITKVWDYKDSLCMALTGTSEKVLGQMGGFKTEYEEGGLTVNVR